MVLGICLDTAFYQPGSWHLSRLLRHPVLTPWNNLRYNLNPENLLEHGLHPYHQHVLANLPLLLGPAYVLLACVRHVDARLLSAVSGVVCLSLFRHQEARFLLPAVPLFLSLIRLPTRFVRCWIGSWIVFNAIMGVFMGVYHQGGIVPTQNFLMGHDNVQEVFWWRTYSPPTWLLDGKNERLKTTVLMGMSPEAMIDRLIQVTRCDGSSQSTAMNATYLVAPESSTYLDQFGPRKQGGTIELERVWNHRRHLNLDDLDWGREGVWGTIKRVIGRRGLTTWKVIRSCA